MSARENGRMTLGVIVLTAVICLGLVVRWALRWHPWLTFIVVALAAVAVLVDPAAVLLAGGLLFVTLGVWAWVWPAVFEAQVVRRARSSWRFELIYRPRWNEAMSLFGLTAQVQDRPSIGSRPAKYAQRRPELVRIVATKTTDRLLVKHRLGHEQAHWDIRTGALAQSFGARSCSVTPADPGYLWLTFRTIDALTSPIRPLRSPSTVDLEAVPVGVTEDGDPWRLRLAGTHVLIGGCMGSGKSSLIWSLLAGIASAIAAGWVQVRAIDPKGGMELIAGAPLFSHYAYPDLTDDGTDPAEAMVILLEDTAELVITRAASMRRAGIRKHRPSATHPTVIVLIDELAYLTAYMTDAHLRKRAHQALGVILSQGRAPGVIVVGAIQDVRKEAVPLRDLFPTRVGLRTTEAAHADLILGDGAYKLGATCDRIAQDTPGVAYVRIDGQPTPMRVRSAYHDDNGITALADTHPAPVAGLELIDDQGDDVGEEAA